MQRSQLLFQLTSSNFVLYQISPKSFCESRELAVENAIRANTSEISLRPHTASKNAIHLHKSPTSISTLIYFHEYLSPKQIGTLITMKHISLWKIKQVDVNVFLFVQREFRFSTSKQTKNASSSEFILRNSEILPFKPSCTSPLLNQSNSVVVPFLKSWMRVLNIRK